MTALANDASRRRRGDARIGRILVDGGSKIYKGALVAIDAAGFAVPASDTAALQIVGIAAETIDNTGGADGAKTIEIEYDGEYQFVCTSITQAMVGDLMVVVDDNTVDDAAGATNDIPVGRLTEFISTTSGWVFVPGLTGL